MNFRKMLIGNARKAMLDNITALDKKTLQQELESHLKLEFEYKDEIERLKEVIHKNDKEIDNLCKNQKKEIERLKNELSIKTTYIEDLLKIILKSDDFKMQREVYRHGIEYDKKLKELKGDKDE